MTTLRHLEELALNALPALQDLHYDGGAALRRRRRRLSAPRHSIQLLYPSTLPLDEKIDFCQAQYFARGSRTVFKMTLAAPAGLEAALLARNYELTARPAYTLDLSSIEPQPDPGAEVIIEPTMSDEWAAANARLHGENPTRAAVINVILKRLAVESMFLRVCHDGETVALGRGSLDHGWVGPYEVITDACFRQQGFGRQVMQHILRWGIDRGAHSAYLQVVAENQPARRLYERLGFREQYRYWYLQKYPPGSA
ncbi:MAG: GNAT family N-acetyltransferase [Anaerolineae bacterium]